MPGVYSKVLPHTCYEIGHTWEPSCSIASFEIFISSFMYSCKMYAIVYAITAVMQYKELDRKGIIKLLKNYLRSSIFLTINGFGYIGVFCLLRHVLGHMNFPSLSFLPGFFSAVLAIYVERPSRRSLLAVYVANVASECLFNVCVGHGYIRPIPRGSAILFSAAMAVFGACYHSDAHQPSPIVASVIKFFVGNNEKGLKSSSLTSSQTTSKGISWSRHPSCPHNTSCFQYILEAGAVAGTKGLGLSCGLALLSTLPRLLRQPGLLPGLLLRPAHLRLAAATASFSALYRLTSCVCRRSAGGDRTSFGAVAGAVAGSSMLINPSTSLALYAAWKALETACLAGIKCGALPSLPGGTELLYSVMTGYLFHVSAVHQHYMKPSYWSLLMNLTANRMAGFNRHLLYPYQLDSERNFREFWPTYDDSHLTDRFLALHSAGLASVPRP